MNISTILIITLSAILMMSILGHFLIDIWSAENSRFKKILSSGILISMVGLLYTLLYLMAMILNQHF